MFKSVFTKYITAFMLIILISFAILAGIITSMVRSYSLESKQETVVNSAINVSEYLEYEYHSSSRDDFNQFIYFNREEAKQNISMLALYTDKLQVIVADSGGNILLYDSNSSFENGAVISGDILTRTSNGENVQTTGTLDGLLETECAICTAPVTDENGLTVGMVVTCASYEEINEFVVVMVKTMIMTILWVLLAALIAVYFISEKIIAPLKDMSKAAKSFASGKFDVRVPEFGNDEVSELAVAFNNMASELSTFEDTRRTFLANVSHDLRTPMTTIAGFIDGIIDGAIPPEKHEYYLSVIASEVRRLSRLVSTLLDISRIQAGERKFNKTPFDICEMARQILISFEQKIDAKNLDVEFDCDSEKMFALADRDAIYQILYNICDNGVKFSKNGGRYRISIVSREKKIYVSVYNEGQGIPESDLPHVFDRFYKSDKSRGLDKTGVGLGLYIAKTIIDAHDEEIWVKSSYGNYCEFVFTLTKTHEVTDKPKTDKFTKQ